ncbi:MAG: choice-of-anchor Q domain-containing protein, partial [Gemmatimonadales bacterium]|jgi:hypothetical protein
VGGGPHTFDCNGPTTISTNREIVIGNDVILDGEGNLILDGQDNHRVLSVPSGSRVTLDGITVTRGYIDDGNGGGIANGGRLTLLNSAVKNSVARLTSRYLKRGYGGGIHNTETVTLINCTVSGNTARGTWQPPTWCWEGPCPDVFVGGDGGGIDNRKTLLLINSTVSENEAEGIGGGIYNQYGHVGRYTNSTISGNRALRGGAIYNNSGGTLTVTNTLVNGVCNEPYGAVVSNGYNVESPGDTCGFDQETDQVNVSAEELNLGRLADNGGPTMTHALLTDPEDSVAIDWIPAQDCLDADGAPLATDQRGEPRPVAILGAEPKCDVGAFEVQP